MTVKNPASARAWDLSGAGLEALLEEAGNFQGRSLWEDAKARLRRSRAASVSIVFLVLVGLASVLAPLLPLPSPMAIDLKAEPAPPTLQLGNNGWQHRISVLFKFAEPLPLSSREMLNRAESRLAGLVTLATKIEPSVARTAGPGGIDGLELALPYSRELDPNHGGDPVDKRIRSILAERAPGGVLELRDGGHVAVRLASVIPRDGYWDLNVLDRTLLTLRHRFFGFWQTGHWFGTDAKGRDLLARIVWGSRVSLQVAIAAALCSLLIGVTYGAVSGYLGGWIDNLMMRIVDVLYSVPFIFVVIFVITVLNEYRTTLFDRWGIEYITIFYVVIGMIYWLTMARVVRGQVLALKNQEFVQAARALGASNARILFVHLVPNVLGVVVVYLTLTIPSVMLFEAFLSFLGLGVEPPKVSWGLLAIDCAEAVNPLRTFWWLVLWPAAAIGTTLLALNVLGDGLRDALDPKLRGR